MPLSLSQTSRRLALAAGALAGTLAMAAPATAGTGLTASLFAGQTPVNECAPSPMSKPFIAFGDLRSYVLAPNGDFSNASGGGWQFTGGASVASAARPVVGTSGVLSLPAGATALSPLMCVDLDYPTARTWVGGTGALTIDVVYPDTSKGLKPKSVGKVAGLPTSAWKLSSDFDVRPQIGGKYAGWRRVSFLLTNSSKSAVQVDDFFVDPRMR
jgi:hypothetical protein